MCLYHAGVPPVGGSLRLPPGRLRDARDARVGLEALRYKRSESALALFWKDISRVKGSQVMDVSAGQRFVTGSQG